MKRIIILCYLLSTCLMVSLKAQTYHPLEECRNDTILYLRKNLIEQKNKFIGKHVGNLSPFFKEIVPYRVYSIETSPWIDPEGNSYLKGIEVSFDSDERLDQLIKTRKTIFTIIIYLEEPWMDVYKFWKEAPEEDRHEWEYVRTLNFIIKDLKLYSYIYPIDDWK